MSAEINSIRKQLNEAYCIISDTERNGEKGELILKKIKIIDRILSHPDSSQAYILMQLIEINQHLGNLSQLFEQVATGSKHLFIS